MPRTPRRRALAAGLALALGACAGPPQERLQVDPNAKPALVSAPFGDLIEQWVDAPGALYVRRPRPDLGTYRSLRYDPPTIFYKRGLSAPLVADHAALLRALGGAMRDQLAVALPLPEAAARGEGVLRVSVEVTDLEFDRSKATNSRVTTIVQPGSAATFVLQLADDASGTPLVRLATRRPMPGGIYTGPWAPDIDRASELFRAFARDARASLAHVVRPLEPPD